MYKLQFLVLILILSVSCVQDKPKPVVVKKVTRDTVAVVDTTKMTNVISKDSFSNAPVVKDIDGNEYEAVRIGRQVWMAKNLNVNHYRNGDEIPNIKDKAMWENLTTGAWCYYKNSYSLVRRRVVDTGVRRSFQTSSC